MSDEVPIHKSPRYVSSDIDSLRVGSKVLWNGQPERNRNDVYASNQINHHSYHLMWCSAATLDSIHQRIQQMERQNFTFMDTIVFRLEQLEEQYSVDRLSTI